MTVEDLISVLLEIIPDARIETDAHGELVIYTGLKMPEDGRHLEIGTEEAEARRLRLLNPLKHHA